jgi:hypothetical protein
MPFRIRDAAVAAAAIVASFAVVGTLAHGEAPAAVAYTSDGKLLFPKDYRNWTFLSSGLGMSYVEGPAGSDPSFTNLFANPEAVAAFEKTGTWPDKTMLVLEVRASSQKGSINKQGRFQSGRQGVEVHVKDQARFKGGWAFYAFSGEGPGQLFPESAACYSCHQAHAAVDTTFVQFYPTLMPIAEAKKTLSPAYIAEEAKGH